VLPGDISSGDELEDAVAHGLKKRSVQERMCDRLCSQARAAARLLAHGVCWPPLPAGNPCWRSKTSHHRDKNRSPRSDEQQEVGMLSLLGDVQCSSSKAVSRGWQCVQGSHLRWS